MKNRHRDKRRNHLYTKPGTDTRWKTEQTGALLSVSCRLVRSLISSNSLKYLSGCIFVLVNRARKLQGFSSQWKRRNYTEQCAPFNTNMMKLSWDFHFWWFHYRSSKNIISAKCAETTSMRPCFFFFSQVRKINNGTWGAVFALRTMVP